MKADRNIYINDTSRCYICENPALFVVEWYGVDQKGENPELVEDRGVCGRFEHLVHASKNDYYDGPPDAIFLKDSDDDEQPELLKIIIGVLNPENTKQALENAVRGEELIRKIKLQFCENFGKPAVIPKY